jgi:colanic acid biosynthesis protein WcaH
LYTENLKSCSGNDRTSLRESAKGKKREKAVHRVARGELGTDVTIEESLGTDEHIYDKAEVDVLSGKHYLSSGYLVPPQNDVSISDNQHESVEWFPTGDLPESHPYVKNYVRTVCID